MPSQLLNNTIATYIRSVVSMFLVLLSSRWVLQALGDSDFGIFCVLGSVVAIVSFLNGIMSISASRFLALYIGKNEKDEVNIWFNTSIGIHLAMSILMMAAGMVLKEHVITEWLSIPADRMQAARILYDISLVSSFFSMMSVPYTGLLTAKQKIIPIAMLGIIQSALLFCFAISLRHITVDKLIVYSAGYNAISIAAALATIAYTHLTMRESSIQLKKLFIIDRVSKLLSYSGWMFFGGMGMTLRNHGSAVLINQRFDSAANAAYGISLQVTNATNQLAVAMLGAFTPEITQTEGAGDRGRLLRLAEQVNKHGTILVMLFAIPLMIEIDYILKLWLVSVPEHTALLCRLIIITLIINNLNSGSMLAISAVGIIAGYQLYVGVLLILTLPLAWIMIKAVPSPASIGYSFIIMMIICSGMRTWWYSRQFKIHMRTWLYNTVYPCTYVGILTLIAGLLPLCFMKVSLIRLSCVCACSITATLLSTYYFATSIQERQLIRSAVVATLYKLHLYKTR